MAAPISQSAIRLILRFSSRLTGSRQIKSLASADGTFFGSLLVFLTKVHGDFLRAEPNLRLFGGVMRFRRVPCWLDLMDDDLSCWTRPQITFNMFADRGGRGHMKYSGVVFAGLIAVIVTAAIYLIAPPSAGPPAAPAAVDISADLPNAFTPSEIHAALSQHEFDRSCLQSR